jgi:hypothetical protein
MAKARKGSNYLFGYGSIISNESRLATGGSAVAACVRIEGSGFERCWNFRSTTGFTALGLQKVAATPTRAKAPPINGIVFPVGDDMEAFDAREVGYTRHRVDQSGVTVLDHTCNNDPTIDSEGSAELRATLRDSTKDCLIWLYVPNVTNTADETYPICQTYVDVVIGGCLEWGGERFANELIVSTSGWSDCFLNDAPLSRRPWLHRKQYQAIDKILSEHEELTFFSKRKHPEEFAAQCIDAMRGMWNTPKRNKLFVGREEQVKAEPVLLVVSVPQ